jgi:hypothetical protein
VESLADFGHHERNRSHPKCDIGWLSSTSGLFGHLAPFVVWPVRRISCRVALRRCHLDGSLPRFRVTGFCVVATKTKDSVSTVGRSRGFLVRDSCYGIVLGPIPLAHAPFIFCCWQYCRSCWSLDLCAIGFQQSWLTSPIEDNPDQPLDLPRPSLASQPLPASPIVTSQVGVSHREVVGWMVHSNRWRFSLPFWSWFSH